MKYFLLLVTVLISTHLFSQRPQTHFPKYQNFDEFVIGQGHLKSSSYATISSEQNGIILKYKANGSKVIQGESIIFFKNNIIVLQLQKKQIALKSSLKKLEHHQLLKEILEKQQQTIREEIILASQARTSKSQKNNKHRDVTWNLSQLKSREQILQEKMHITNAVIVEQKLEIEKNTLAVKEWKIKQSQYQITAPISGILSYDIHINRGVSVEKNDQLATILQSKKLQAICFVPSKALRVIKLGSNIKIDTSLYEDRLYPAVIDYIGSKKSNRGFKVVASLKNTEVFWRDGIEIKVKIILAKAKYLTIPKSAIVYDLEGNPFVYIQSRNRNHIRKSEILQLGPTKAQLVSVKRGLQREDSVVINPQNIQIDNQD
ncbi:efflux RND transporter periplasmic adaptor subunit [Candidatus Uabimicrobium sp. HlEnr_7]|uniref:efflux RND transporter periplasmic adaptor subunit n=1 Tax=Candidatus Uabimicrobium helgolandensis TaxID=3095367 RepID=UPI003558659C